MTAMNPKFLTTIGLILFVISFLSCNEAKSPNGKFLMFTDFHIDDHYDPRGDPAKMCHGQQNDTTLLSGLFGSHNCDPPMALIEFLLGEAKKQLPDPDYIIWTGDTAAHDQYDQARLIRTMESANGAIRKHFPNIVVIPVLGNHESVPGNDWPDAEGLEIYAEIFDGWKEWIGEDEHIKDTFLRGGYYRFKSPLDNSTFIVLNTNMYYEIDNFSNSDDPTRQFEFLAKELENAKNTNAFVHILAHIPIGAYEMYPFDAKWKPEMPKRYNEKLFRLFVEYSQWIRWMLFGHLHTDTFRIIKDLNAVQRMFLSPSVTPMFDLNNPAFRIFEYNPANFDIEDIQTYYVELDELNSLGANKTHAKLEYSMREAYGIREPLSAKTMNDLLENLRQNWTMFDEYFQYNKVQWKTHKAGDVERSSHLCVLEYADHDRLSSCMFKANGDIVVLYSSPKLVIFAVIVTILLTKMMRIK